MQLPPRNRQADPGFPCLENLEGRLLLTTLTIPTSGDYQRFLYHSSQDETVLVTFGGQVGDTIELLAMDYGNNVVDLPGVLMSQASQFYFGPDDVVPWPGGMYGELVTFGDDSTTWVENVSMAEIFAVYVAKSSPDTVMTFSTVSGTLNDAEEPLWSETISTWGGTSANLVLMAPDPLAAPSGSGGALVGGEYWYTDDSGKPVYGAVSSDAALSVNPTGAFPGGALRPGITVANSQVTDQNTDHPEGVGNSVQALAIGPDGKFYVVDSGVFSSDSYSDTTSFGAGLIVNTLAIGANSRFYSVDNARGTILDKGDGLGGDIDALAFNSAGVMYWVDNTSTGSTRNTLWRSLSPDSAPISIGTIQDGLSPGLSYDVKSLAFDENGVLYGLATVVDLDPSTPPEIPLPASAVYLIKIDTGTGLAHRGPRVQDTDPATTDWPIAIAFDGSGNMYGVDGSDNLVSINHQFDNEGIEPENGQMQVIAHLNQTGITGIEFVNGLLYAVTSSNLYLVNAATGACTDLGPTGVSDMDSLAFDPTDPTHLYSATHHVGGQQPLQISLDSAARLLVGGSEGDIDDALPLIDASNPDLAYRSVHAMAFNGSLLYATGEAVDTDFADGFDDAPAGVFFLQIDPATGAVTRLAALSGPEDLSGMAFDSAGNLFGVHDNTLWTINLGTGVATSVSAGLPANMIGLQFVSIGGNDVLFGLTSGGDLYSINPADGDATLLGDTNFTTHAGLAVDPANPDFLWTASDAGSYVLADIPLFGRLVKNDQGTVLGKLQLKDSIQAAYTFQMGGMDFNSAGQLYAFATVVNIDPLNVDSAADQARPWLVRIDPTTGVVTRIAQVTTNQPLTTLSFYDSTEYFPRDTIFTTDVGVTDVSNVTNLGVNATNLAINNGFYYTVTATDLISTDTMWNPVVGSVGALAEVSEIDKEPDEITISFGNINSSDFDDTGRLWAVGEVLDTSDQEPNYSGTHLLQISTERFVHIIPGEDGAPDTYVYRVAVTVGPALSRTFSTISFSGSTLYGIDAATGNTLYTIDRTTGATTLLAQLDAGSVAEPFIGIEVLNGYMLGVTATHLYLIDPSTGKCVDLGATTGVTDLTGLANNPAQGDVLYGVGSDGKVWEIGFAVQLKTVRMDGTTVARSAIRDSLTATTPFGITGMDFSNGRLYAVVNYGQGLGQLLNGSWVTGKQILYEINPVSGQATMQSWLWPDGGLSSLSADPNDPNILWATDLITAHSSLDEAYQVAKIDMGGQDVDRIMIAGTLAGRLETAGNLDTLYMGYLWGNIVVSKDLGTIATRTGAAGVFDGDGNFYTPSTGSGIYVDGSLGMVDSRGDSLDFYSAVYAGNTLENTLTDRTIYELEVATQDWKEEDFSFPWIMGYMDDYSNDTPEQAQFLSSSTGNFTLNGTLYNDAGILPKPNNDAVTSSTFLTDREQDWYALSLMAGQTFVMDGTLDASTDVFLFDASGHLMGTYGYETLGTTLKSLTFTAPAAGVYYIAVAGREGKDGSGGDYQLNFTNATAAALGAINIVGNYGNGGKDAKINHVAHADEQSGNVLVENGGNLGAIVVSGRTYGLDVYATGGGNIGAVRADEIGVDTSGTEIATNIAIISSEGNIGSVSTITGAMYSKIYAGANDGAFNADAFIQNISVATEYRFGSILSASGSIGVIDVGGIFGQSTIRAGSDGEGGNIDLIRAGSFGGVDTDNRTVGIPRLYTGDGGNVGYVYVVGEIWQALNGNSGIAHAIAQPYTGPLIDDGGGSLRITPVPTTSGLIVPSVYTPRISYISIPVNDGAGQVIARLMVDGSVNMTVTGNFEISDLDIGAGWGVPDPAHDDLRPTTATVNIGGSGVADIYFAHDGAARSSGNNPNGDGTGGDTSGGNFEVVNLVNRTRGDLVSGHFGAAVGNLVLGGSLGYLDDGSTGAWLHGAEVAPASADIADEPQYGWFGGWMNGLMIDGIATDQPGTTVGATKDDFGLDYAEIGGSLGDLRVLGTIRKVEVDSDSPADSAGGWDGVNGLVWSQKRIGSIAVGDGLAGYGSATVARAGIMSTGSIGTVSIKGPYREVIPLPTADINERLKGTQYFGLLSGAIIGKAGGYITATDSDGNIITDRLIGGTQTVFVDGVGSVTGTNGARCSALINATDFDAFQVMLDRTIMYSGGIGTISFFGRDAAIYGTSVGAQYVRKISTSIDSYGIVGMNVWAYGTYLPTGLTSRIGEIDAGGYGMYYSTIRTTGGDIGIIKGVGDEADFGGNTFVSDGNLKSISGRDFFDNTFSIANTIQSFDATGDVYGTSVGDQGTRIGSITKMSVDGDFRNNVFVVSGVIGSLDIGGSFIDSTLILDGPSEANLKKLTVAGETMTGTIRSYGQIGSIISKGSGGIAADISTVEGGWNNDVALISTVGGMTGSLDIAGSLKKFTSGGSLGSDPTTTSSGRSQTYNIGDDLGDLEVTGPAGANDVFAEINVGGNIGTVNIGGTLYGQLNTNGNLNSLTLGGGLGGWLDFDLDGIDETAAGSVDVFGDIVKMQLNPTSDLVADLTVGGSLSKLTLTNADIVGDITSRYGSITDISVTGGNIQGDLEARSFGRITVRNGDVSGDITATSGNIASFSLRGGTLSGSIEAEGTIDMLNIVGGTTAGQTIQAGRGMGRLTITGDLDADILSGLGIDSLTVRGGNINGDVNAEMTIGTVTTDRAITGTLRSGSYIGRVSAGSLNGATISSAWNIGTVSVTGNMANSFILAGYDTGANGVVDGVDDNPITGDVHSGDIASVSIGGMMNRSIVAAGVAPGPHTGDAYADYFTTRGDNVAADGVSNVFKMTVRGGAGSGANQSAVMADTSIDPKLKSSVPNLVVDPIVDPLLNGGIGTTDFGPGTAQGTILPSFGLTLTLTGQGRANFNEATGELILEQTNSSSRLTLTGSSAHWAGGLRINGSDDSGLGSLTVAADVILDDVSIDGAIGTLTVASVHSGANWSLPGGVGSATLTDASNADITAGLIKTLSIGAFTGALTADGIGTLTATADLDGDVTSTLGGITSVTIRSGDLDGDITSRGTLGSLQVGGDVDGSVSVTHGNLTTFRAGTGFDGQVDVARGGTTSLTVTAGDLSGSYRTATGLGSVTVSKGGLDGLVSAGGNVSRIAVSGVLSGRVWTGGNLDGLTAGSMDGGMVAASGNFKQATLKGDMTDSSLYAGFNPGDGGYVPNETGNLMLDAFADPANDGQVDQVLGGSVGRVTIGGEMTASVVSAGVDPGADGYIGTADDRVGGAGTVGSVTVKEGIYGSGSGSYGVYAATGMPVVLCFGRQPFVSTGNVSYGSMSSAGGNLTVTNVTMTANKLLITFSHRIDLSTVALGDTLKLYVSETMAFDPLETTELASRLKAPTFDTSTNQLVLTLKTGTWQTLANSGLGEMYKLVLDGTDGAGVDGYITDSRGQLLDGEFTGSFPSGNGQAGGDFTYTIMRADRPDTFVDAIDAGMLPLVLDGGSMLVGNTLTSWNDVDVYSFTADAYDYFSAQILGSMYYGSSVVEMCLFYQDTQGTATLADDTFESVTHIVTGGSQTIPFLAVELPETATYFLAVTPAGYTPDDYSYQVRMTLASSDSALLADLGGALPADQQIAYVSNYLGEHNNSQGYNDPKQLVYINFDGGIATKYEENSSVTVTAFDLSLLDPSLRGMEDTLIYGDADVTGIMDNIVSIYSNIAGTAPGDLDVHWIDPTNAADWAQYLADDAEGLWFTTIDPSVKGLDSSTDFTTVFVGEADQRTFTPGGILWGQASNVDESNMSKADNALVLTNNFAWAGSDAASTYGRSYAGSVDARLMDYSTELANTIAHELGHVLGLNHQPTDRSHYLLQSDDPDNNPATPNDSNRGVGLMAYYPMSVSMKEVTQLGTAKLNEFTIGQVDTQAQLLWWLS